MYPKESKTKHWATHAALLTLYVVFRCETIVFLIFYTWLPVCIVFVMVPIVIASKQCRKERIRRNSTCTCIYMYGHI